MPYGDSGLIRFLLDRWELVLVAVTAIGAIFTRKATQDHKVKMMIFEIEAVRSDVTKLKSDVSALANAQQGESVTNAVYREKTEALEAQTRRVMARLDNIGSQIGEVHQAVVMTHRSS